MKKKILRLKSRIGLMAVLFLASIQMHAQLASGTYLVGAAAEADYATLTDAMTAASAGISGDVVFELDGEELEGQKIFVVSDFEINSFESGGHKFTIRPSIGSVVFFNGATKIIGGSEGIIFDGRPGGQGTENAMVFKQSSSDVVAKNAALNIYQTSSNITVRYCDFQFDSQYGLKAEGFSNEGDTLKIENCTFTTATSNGYTGA